LYAARYSINECRRYPILLNQSSALCLNLTDLVVVTDKFAIETMNESSGHSSQWLLSIFEDERNFSAQVTKALR
jgi:hypothetical protein